MTNIKKIKDIAEEKLQGDSAHDIDHVLRVYNLALIIAKKEKNIDFEVLEIAALLHDIGGQKEAEDPSGNTDHAVIGAEMAEEILKELNCVENKIKHIKDCILSHRYRNSYEPKTIEAKILFDADKLETVGAIGAARVFAWVGKHKARIYKKVNIDDYIKENQSGKINGRIQDKSKHSAQINYEVKDRFLLDKLYTKVGKEIGRERLKYYKNFLDRLENEIKGKM